LFLHNEEVALSPNWSTHFGVGTANYKFIWGMAGENQVFDDMDQLKPLNCAEAEAGASKNFMNQQRFIDKVVV